MIAIGINESISQMVRNVIPSEQMQWYGVLSQMAERSTLSSIASSGNLPRGDLAAAAIASLIANSRVATHLIANATNRAMGKALSIVLEWIQARGDPVTVAGAEGIDEELAPSGLIDVPKRVRFELIADKQLERQFVAGMATQLLSSRGVGYNLFHDILERGGISEMTSTEMMQDLMERMILETTLPGFAKETIDLGRTIAGMKEAIPEAPPVAPPSPAAGLMQVNPQDMLPPQEGLSGGAIPPAPPIEGMIPTQ